MTLRSRLGRLERNPCGGLEVNPMSAFADIAAWLCEGSDRLPASLSPERLAAARRAWAQHRERVLAEHGVDIDEPPDADPAGRRLRELLARAQERT